MKIECVTVCINYADRLAKVLPFNLPHFDRWIIATSPDDHATRRLCWRYNLECLLSNDHARNGPFNKGRLIERALHHTSAGQWRLHLDGDIALPANFRRTLEQAHLDESCIYGADRIMCRSNAEWERLKASGWLHGATRWGTHSVEVPSGFTIGARWASPQAGYVPIGFFQLWHGSEDEYHGARVKPYPIQHGSACRSDVQHALQWDRRCRLLVPELIVAHIDDGEPVGANWNGRGKNGGFFGGGPS